MCEFNKRYSHKKQPVAIAYKMVAKRISDGTYHSLSMGCEYPKLGNWGDVPIVKQQVLISREFNDEILRSCFNHDMVGRTAGFLNKHEAVEMIYEHETSVDDGYEAVVVIVELRKSLLKGDYESCEVVAGKQMKIVGEV